MRYIVGLMALGLLTASGLAQEDAVQKEMKRLQGTWAVESAVKDGKDFDRIKEDRLVIAGDRITVKSKDKDHGGTYKLDLSKKPAAIDFMPEDANEKTVQAIYELKGDTLKLCFAEPDTERPTEFKAEEGSRRILVILKRVKS